MDQPKYYNEARKEASLKYQKKHIEQIKFALHTERDADIIAYLDSLDNRTGYLKQLLRSEIARTGFKTPAQNPAE